MQQQGAESIITSFVWNTICTSNAFKVSDWPVRTSIAKAYYFYYVKW